MCVWVCVCVFFIGSHTVGPTELKFGMEDHIYPWEVIGRAGGGQRVVLEVRAAQTVNFCDWRAPLQMAGQVRSDLIQVSGSWSKCKGASAAMVSWPLRLKFGKEMGTHPGRSGTLKMGFQGTICPNYEWFSRVWLLRLAGALQWAVALQRAWKLQRV